MWRRSTALFALWLATHASRGLAGELEQQIKSEFIERFTRFVDWPDAALPAPGGAFATCVAGTTPLEALLRQVASSRRAKGHPVEIKHTDSAAELRGCQILFIAGSAEPRLHQLLDKTSGRPILTISDSPGFAERGVLINLYVDDEGHVRFEVNAAEAKKSGLSFSSQLLKLARLVGP